MGKKKRNVEPRNKVEEKDSRNERVFGGNQIEDEQADAGHGLAKTQSMRAQQCVLEEVIFRATERFQDHSHNQHRAVNAVTPPSQFGARGVKSDQYPNPDPENASDDHDLAEQEEAVETFRPL